MMNVTLLDRLPAAPAWDALFAHCGATDYFSSRPWYELFVDTVAARDGGVSFIVAGDDPQDPAAVLPLWSRPRASALSLRRVTSLANYYSCLYQPLLAADKPRARAGLDAIAAWLAAGGARWSVVDLLPLPDDAWYLDSMTETFARHGYAIKRYPAFGNWYIPTPGMDYATYFNGRGKKMRSTVRSKTNQLQEKYDFDLRVVQGGDELERAIDVYNAVYATSWKQAEPYPDFIPGFVRSLAAHGQLRLGTLTLDGKPAAAQLWFVAARAAHIFKLAYNPDYAQFSVGTLLTMKLVEHVLDTDHVEVIDFLSGDDDYKKQWMSHRRERIGLEMARMRSLPGLLVGARRVAGRLRRRLLPETT